MPIDGSRKARRPLVNLQAQVEVDDDPHHEHRAFDDHEPDRSPPDQASGTERVVRQLGNIDGGARRHASLRAGCSDSPSRSHWVERSELFGQNQPINVTVSGSTATGSAHGVKIDPMKKADVTTAAEKWPDAWDPDTSVLLLRLGARHAADEDLATVGPDADNDRAYGSSRCSQ